jgi:putative ABC transport system permease protein
MLLAALRDLQWRRRRFLLAVLGAGLVFATSLVGVGLSAAFRNEVDRTLEGIGADAWLVDETVAGPFSLTMPLPVETAAVAATLAGVEEAAPLLFSRWVITSGEAVDVNLIGVVPGALGSPPPSEGAALSGNGQAIADRSLGYDVGDRIDLGGTDVEIVGTVSGATLYGGSANVYVTLEDAQRVVFAGEPFATTVVTRGRPAADALPPGLKVMTNADVKADALRVLANAVATVDFVNVLLWIVAVSIMGSILYLSAIERTRDIAVYKATGTSTSAIAGGLALQALILAVSSSLVAIAIGLVLAPFFPLPSEIPGVAFVAIPLIAAAVSLVASLAAMRRAVTVQPALAFGG